MLRDGMIIVVDTAWCGLIWGDFMCVEIRQLCHY